MSDTWPAALTLTPHISQRTGFQRTAGLAKRTVGLGGETFDGGENRLAIAFGELTDLTTHADARAVAQQHVGRALANTVSLSESVLSLAMMDMRLRSEVNGISPTRV